MSSIKKNIEGHRIGELNGVRTGGRVDIVAFMFVFQETVRVCHRRFRTQCCTEIVDLAVTGFLWRW